MKYLKMLGLAAAAAAAIMAFAGAGTASADILCSTNTSPCTGTEYTAGQTISATQVGTSELVGNFPVKCSGGSAGGSVTSVGGAEVLGEITTLTFTGCKIFGIVNCTVTTTVASGGNYAVNANATGSGNGTFGASTGSKKPGAVLNCGGSGTCKFGEASVSLGFTGSATEPLLKAGTELVLEAGDPQYCGSTAEWEATFKITTPAALFLL